MDITTLNIVIGLCFGAGLFMFCLIYFPTNLNFLANRLDEGTSYMAGAIDDKDGRYAVLKAFLPYAQKLSAKNADKVKKDRLKEISARLLLAGSPLHMKPIEFYNMSFVSAISLFIIGTIFSLVLDFGLVLGFVGAAVGYLLPNMVINSLIKKRAQECDMELPEVLDLLSVCMNSGMNLENSIKTVCDKTEGLLVNELKFVLADHARSASYVEAFEGLTRRVDSERVAKLLQIVELEENYGTPAAEPLKITADAIREDTFEAVKQHAAKAASTVMIPVIAFILPAMVLIVAGPLILRAMAG